MTSKISIESALALISSGDFSPDMEVSFEQVTGVEALDALKLGEAGVHVPENLIFYDDAAIVDDDDFEGPWQAIDNDVVEEAKWLKLEMRIEPEIKDWLEANQIDASLLIEKLIKDTYQTSKLVQKIE